MIKQAKAQRMPSLPLTMIIQGGIKREGWGGLGGENEHEKRKEESKPSKKVD